jgi:hypothetical protein
MECGSPLPGLQRRREWTGEVLGLMSLMLGVTDPQQCNEAMSKVQLEEMPGGFGQVFIR